MALTAPTRWNIRPRGQGHDVQSFKILNAEVIYNGALVTLDLQDGYLRNLEDTSGTNDRFCGIAIPKTNSVTGDTSASPVVECPVSIGGCVLEKVAVTGASAVTNTGDPVFATDENTLTLSSTSNLKKVGVVLRWYSSTTCDVGLFSMYEYLANLGGNL